MNRRVRFRSWNLWVMGPPCGLRNREGDVLLHGHDSMACQKLVCQLCRQQCWYRGRGTKRTTFLLVERGGPTGKGPVNYIQSQARGITLTTGCTGESGFVPVELGVMGLACGLNQEGVTYCTVMIARQVRGQPVSYVGNNVGTKGDGRREPFFCSLR